MHRLLPLCLAIGFSVVLAGTAGSAQLGPNDSELYAPAELIVKLRADVGSLAPDAVSSGFAARSHDPETASLDELLDRQRVQRLRRVFRSREDAQGGLRRTTRQIVAERLRQRGLRAGPRLDALLAEVPDLENVFLVTLEEGMSAAEAVAAFSMDAAVEWAEPNWTYRAAAEPLPAVPYVPDDRYVTQDDVTWSQGVFPLGFPDLYGLRNTRAIEGWNQLDTDGSGSFDPGETRPGEGILVAVIDSGVDASHPDLVENIWVSPGEIPGNGIDDDGNGFVDDVSGWDFAGDDNDPSDPHGHGTHVAGTVAALADNGGVGVAGVGPAARVLPIRGLDANGSGSASDLAAAVDYAVANGAHITSNSWGGPVSSQLLTAAFAAAEAAGVLNIAAAGNGTIDVSGHTPSNLDSVMAVAAVDHQDVRATFTNFGDGVEISAPGVNVLSLNANAGNNVIARLRPGSVVAVHYLEIGGTSMATPHVSGAAAVLMSAFPAAPAEEIRGRLMGGAQPIDAQNPGSEGALGAGRLDLMGSLSAVPGPVLRLVDFAVANFQPGEQAQLSVSLRNFWLSASNVTAVLTTEEPELTVDSGAVALGDVAAGETVQNDTEPFLVSLDPDAGFGSFAFTLEIQADGGLSETFQLSANASFMIDVTAAGKLPSSGTLPKFTLFQDYSGDDQPDVLFADLIGNAFIYENLGEDDFRRRNARVGLEPSFNAFNSHFIDVDNDGDRDLQLGGTPFFPSKLLLSQGDGTTLDISESSGIAQYATPWSAAIDYNGDGFVDLVGGVGDDLLNEEGEVARPMQLLENQGNLTFVDRRAESGLPISPFP
ncbi:MAG: S8 family serine peptidase, partial [Planctomycetota bacterium]